MSEPRKILDLPDDSWAIAFRGVEAVLREDPTLAEHVKVFRSRRGEDDDMQVPALDEMPLVALSPVPQPDRILDTSTASVNFAVSVEVFVAGTCVDDILNLWGAIVRAVHPCKPMRGGTVQEFLRCKLPAAPPMPGSTTPVVVQVHALRATTPAFLPVDVSRPGRDGNTPAMQRGLGLLTCYFQRPA